MSIEDRASRFRWRIANLADNSNQTCWSQLVDWALDPDGDRDARGPVPALGQCFDGEAAARCRKEARERESCYCGKFATEATDGHILAKFRPDGSRVKAV